MSETAPREVSFGFTQEKFPSGTHMCYIYTDEGERHDTILKFVESGLLEGEEVHYFCHGGKAETLEAARERVGIREPADGRKGALKLAQAMDVYCPDGTFIPERMLGYLSDTCLSSLKNGLAGTRFAAEMEWALQSLPSMESLIEFESRANTVFALHQCTVYPCSVVCQYDARRFDGATLFHVLSVHPFMVVRGHVVRNPYYIQPDEFLAKLHQHN